MKQNKQHGSKSINCNLQTWPFEPTEQSMCFPRGPLEWVMEAKNINDIYILYLRSHVSKKQGNRSKENAGRWQNKKYSLCQRNVPWVLYTKFRRTSGVSKHFAFLIIMFAINIKFCVSSNLLFSFTSCQQPTFFECIVVLL